MLDSILRCAGYRTGLYTSPHLLRYNERVRIAGARPRTRSCCEAFARGRGCRLATPAAGGAPVTLTYFEFGTLAALWLFARAGLDALVLEVGLGGRLDAVNIVDADVAVVTSVDIDHVDYLGPTREDIGREKAGIFRAGRPALCADRHPPDSVAAAANAIGAQLLRIGRDYDYVDEGTQWRYRGPRGGGSAAAPAAERVGRVSTAGPPQGANSAPGQRSGVAASVGTRALRPAVSRVARRVPARQCRDRARRARSPARAVAGERAAMREGLLAVDAAGRFQVLPGRPAIVLDVAHNPHAARALADALGAMGYYPETIAVCAMLADKDIAGVVTALRDARRPLVRRDHAGTARRERAARCATRSPAQACRRTRSGHSTMFQLRTR